MGHKNKGAEGEGKGGREMDGKGEQREQEKMR